LQLNDGILESRKLSWLLFRVAFVFDLKHGDTREIVVKRLR